MFCTKCGSENPNNTAFCTQCGASLASGGSAGKVSTTTASMTPAEYFAGHCSADAKKKRTLIKVLSIISLTIQGIMAVLVVLGVSALMYALSQQPLFNGSASSLGFVIAMMLILTGCSFLFTIKALKKFSAGFFVAAMIFGFFSTTLGAGLCLESLAMRWLVICGTLAIYIAILVLNGQNNKEFKAYLLNNRT